MSETITPTPKHATDALEVHVEGYGLVALGSYLALFTMIIVVVIWRATPSCDAAGFVVSKLAPVEAVSTGGEPVRILGEGFQRGVTVRVGDRTTNGAVISPFEIAITTPPLPPGRVAVTVSQEGYPPMEVPGGLLYVPAGPVVKRVVPAQVLAEGGESVRIFGERFKGGANVKIGALEPTNALLVNPSELVITAPKHAVGTVDILVSQGAEGKELVSLPGGLQFVAARAAAPLPAPFQVSTIEPSNAQSTGGEQVTITGSGFTSDTNVRFGGVPARSVRVDSPRFLTAITPMHRPGAVNVAVANEQGLSVLDGKFSFVCPAAPDGTMNLIVLLAGALGGLVHALRSFFWYAGHRKLLVQWVAMYLLLPFSSAALGFVFYLVIRAGLYQPTVGTSYLLVGLAALVGMFSAQAAEKLKAIAEGIFSPAPQGANQAPPTKAPSGVVAPTITGIKPAFGPVAGSTVVTVVGTGFTAQSVVLFDRAVATSTKFVSATTLKAVAPPRSAAGTVDLTVKVGDKEVVKEKAYTYVVAKGSITDVKPKVGVPTGGTRVTIIGSQFPGDVTVSFGEELGGAVQVVDPSTIEVTTPAQAAGKVDVRVDTGTELVAVASGAFEYKP